MARRSFDQSGIWSAPFEIARTMAAAGETVTRAQAVIAARMPGLLTAIWAPWMADHRELSLMVSEKISATRRSARSASAHGATFHRAMDGQARALGRIGERGFATPFDWFEIAEQNMTIAASLIALPGEMLRPFHAGVTANAKRLGVAQGAI
jgi:hypothetical protein